MTAAVRACVWSDQARTAWWLLLVVALFACLLALFALAGSIRRRRLGRHQ
jgi:hypothetical protein